MATQWKFWSKMNLIPWSVNLLSLDQTEYFETTLWSTQAFLSSYAELNGSETVQINHSVITMDPDEITQVIYGPADVLHLMSHAESGGTAQGKRKFLGFIPLGTVFDPESLAEYASEISEYPEIECLLFDACESGTATWARKLRSIVAQGKKLTLIGTTRKVDIDETLAYTMAFYQVLLKQGRPKTVAARHRAYSGAHEKASQVFKQVRGRKCPFVLKAIVGK